MFKTDDDKLGSFGVHAYGRVHKREVEMECGM